jgi:hypothetical protein
MLWPFKYINGEQTEESKVLEAKPQEKPLTGYNIALLEIKGISPGNEEEALL